MINCIYIIFVMHIYQYYHTDIYYHTDRYYHTGIYYHTDIYYHHSSHRLAKHFRQQPLYLHQLRRHLIILIQIYLPLFPHFIQYSLHLGLQHLSISNLFLFHSIVVLHYHINMHVHYWQISYLALRSSV